MTILSSSAPYGTTIIHRQAPGSTFIDISHLKPNSIIDKGKTGCGATTGFLNNDEAMIMVMPYIMNIDNKFFQYNDRYLPGKINKKMFRFHSNIHDVKFPVSLLGFDKERAMEEFKEYLENCKKSGSPPKILVTPDSLPIVMDEIIPKDFTFVWDEIHSLILNYKLRHVAMNNILNNFKKFKNFYLISTTISERDYWPEELKTIPVQNVVWENENILKAKMVLTNSYDNSLIYLIRYFIDSGCIENCYIFINNVRGIEKLIKKCKLKESDYSAIYSQSRVENIKRWIPNCEPTKITFITSVGYESIDIVDENAIPFVATNTRISTTIVNPYIDIVQMIGRFRNTKYKGVIVHILQFSKKANIFNVDKTNAEINANILYENEKLEVEIKCIRSKNEGQGLNFHIWDNGLKKYRPDPELKKYYIYTCLKRSQYISKNKLTEAYKNGGFHLSDITCSFSNLYHYSILPNSFKKTVQELNKIDEMVGQDNHWFEFFYRKAINKYPFLEPALKYFGYEWMEKKKYDTKFLRMKFKNYPKRLINDPDPLKIFILKMDKFDKKEKISIETYKSIFHLMEIEMGFSFFTTASDLKKYYNITKTHIYDKGKKTSAYILGNRII
ncbi:hypothetical protein [Cyclobacterium amurskyense]|uniref:Uncharacterized protein n=1 Tax=Cyclobacterium amurskyense TaxID=320787 RepID=A0A0H4PT79_9BACT|nr:hypothetical protein [Cyclobacterium amurskyense]AKP51542.1 hypothetical protein CA2015_2120 [Cyclobacterium amurskyense]